MDCKLQTIVYKKTDEWYIELQQVTANGTASDNEWHGVFISANFLFFRQEPTNRHPKENPLNLEEDLEEDLLN